jgi:hypothetical protein
MKYFNKKISRILILLLIIIFFSGNAEGLYGAPYATTLSPTNVMSTSATLQGEVNPNGLPTQAFFSSADPNTSPSFFSTTPNMDIGDAIYPVPVNYSLTGLMPGTAYSYTVNANNGAGGKVGGKVTFTTLSTAPSAPQDLIATAGSNSITITWYIPASNGGSPITGYKILRGTTSGGEIQLTNIANILTYTDTSVTSGQIYYYKVSAVNSQGEGAMSKEANATVPVQPITVVTVNTPPLAHLNVMVTSESGSIGIGMTSTIKVTVISSSEEISGADVMLASTSSGKVNPGSGTTDLFGQFTSTFTASAEGIITVRALVKKAGFEDGKGEVQIMVTPIQTPAVTLNISQSLEQESSLRDENVNPGKNDNITPREGYETPKITGKEKESGFFEDFSVILFVAASAGIIYLIYWKRINKLKGEKAPPGSVIKFRRCSNCGMEAPGDNNFCEKCGKPLMP